MTSTAAVVGGGVIGLACARALAGRGVATTLFEASRDAREASWAAAGILGPGSENVADSPLFRLSWDALRLWPEVLAELRDESGIDAGWQDEGTVLVALDEDDAGSLETRARFLEGVGFPVERWNPARAAEREPALSRDVLGALWIGEARCDNRALWNAYDAACAKRGVAMRRGEPVFGLVRDGARVTGVRTAGGDVRADAVVIASGAWSEALGRAAGIALPTVPVKGQMARVRVPDGFVRRAVKRGLHYAVPHAGAGLVLGTTSETVGFDRSVDEAVVAGVQAAVARFLPGVGALPRVETWSGFRPRLADGVPAIGSVPRSPGLFVATGHYRNGILLAEVTARLVADAVLGREDRRIAAFSPERFGA